MDKKPQRFEIGQAVTLRSRGKITQSHPGNWPLPKFGEIYHVHHYEDDEFWGTSEWYIALNEFPPFLLYSEKAFDPVELTDSNVHELVEQSISIEQPA